MATTTTAASRWAAVDWGNTEHVACIVDADDGKVVESFQFKHSAKGLETLVTRLREAGNVLGVGIELKRHLVVDKLLEAGFTVFMVNPKITSNWRKCWKVSPSKSDLIDAQTLAFGLRLHHAGMRPLVPDTLEVRKLVMLCKDEMKLVRQRSASILRLKASLKAYYPQALEFFGNWSCQSAWDFIIRFPTPESFVRARKSTIIAFLKAHRIGMSPTWMARVDNRSNEWTCDEATVQIKSLLAVAQAKILRVINAQIDVHLKTIDAIFSKHVDAEIFSSLPGAGEKTAPRLLAMFGTRRERYPSAAAIQQLVGTVPVTHASGRTRLTKFRWACQKPFRTTMHLFAEATIRSKKCRWARVCYDQCRSRGQSHSLALRNLATRWLKVIYRMWRDRVIYDDTRYEAALVRRGSPVGQALAAVENSGEKTSE